MLSFCHTQHNVAVTVLITEQGFSTRQAFNHLTRPKLNNLGLTRGGMRILESYIHKNNNKHQPLSPKSQAKPQMKL